MTIPFEAYRGINFGDVMVPVYRIVCIRRDSSGKALVYYARLDNDISLSITTVSYEQAMRLYYAAVGASVEPK